MTSITVGAVYTSLAAVIPGFPGTVVKSTLLLGVVLGIAGLMRRMPASARHLVWSMGILGALLIPVLSQTIPQLPVLPAAPRQTVTALPSSMPTVSPGVLEPVSSTDIKAAGGGAETTSANGTKAGVFFGATGEEAPATPESTSLWNTHAIVRAVVIVWLAGAVGLIGWILLGMFLVSRIVRQGAPLRDYRWVQLLGAVSEDMGVVAPVRLVRSNALPMPVTSGVVRPVVILPEGSEDWDQDRRRAVLMHELAHVRRHDLVWHMLARVACALYWFHPLVWYAARKLRAESERACDDLVLNAGTQASDYADHLLQIVRSAGSSRTPATAVPMAQRSEFEGRLLAILDSGVKRHGLTLARGLGIVLAVAVSTIPLAALGRAPQVPAQPEPAVSLVDPTSNAVDSTPVATLPTPESDSPIQREMTTVGLSDDLSPETSAPERKVEQEEQSSAQQTEAGVDLVATLIVALDDPDRGVRMAALEALARMEDSRALPGATQALGSEDPAMRVAALQVLSHMGDPRALPATLPLLEDPDRRVRVAAAEAVGEFQDSTAIAALSKALRDDADPEVRKTAAWALGEIDDSRAVPVLMAALSGDTSAEVRATAAWALGEIEDPSALDALGAAVRDENTQVRRQAIEAIGEIDDRRAVPVLIPLLDDADPEVRKLAVWALGELADPASVDALGKATLDSNAEVRRTAVRALGEVEDPRALDYLIVTLRDSDAEVRGYSAWALGEIEDVRALDALVAAVRDENAEVRSQAVHALGHLEDPRAEAGLSVALTDEHVDVRVQAADALGDLDLSVAPPALIAAMNDASPEVRKVAAHSLGNIGDPAATDALAAGVNDPNRDVRLTSLQALGEMGTQRSLEILVQSMSSEDPEVRRVAARMLGRRGDR
jgi:HEAT repeat protein/beta-lactamase regulating signal transducer with metallopeptidase domain